MLRKQPNSSRRHCEPDTIPNVGGAPGNPSGRSQRELLGTTRGVWPPWKGRVCRSSPAPPLSLDSWWACPEFSPRETRVGRLPPEGEPPRAIRCHGLPLPVRGHVAGAGQAQGKEAGPWGKEPLRHCGAKPKASGFGAETRRREGGEKAGCRMGRPGWAGSAPPWAPPR